MRLDSPTNDSLRFDAEHFGRKVRYDFGSAGLEHQNFTANLDAARSPRIDGGKIIHDKGDARVVVNIAEFFSLGKVVTTDVYCVQVGVIAECHRHHMRLPIGTNRGEAAQSLALQIGDLSK